MSPSARVKSIEALRDFKAALAEFQEDARSALEAIDRESRRLLEWLKGEQRAFWQHEIKRCTRKVEEARAELNRKRISAGGPNRAVDDSEQREALCKAQEQLLYAEEKLKAVKRWVPVIEQAIYEYRGRSSGLDNLVAGDVPKALALMDRMIDALEAYVAMAPPATAAPAMAGSSAEPDGAAVSTVPEPSDSAPEPEARPDSTPEPSPSESSPPQSERTEP